MHHPMQDQIICPHCKQTIPLTEALSHELNDKYQKQLEEERQKNRVIMQEWQQKQLKRVQEERERIQKESAENAKGLEEKLRQKIGKEVELKMLNSQNEAEELKKETETLTKQLLETTKSMRQLKTENEQKQLEMEKKLTEEQERIRQEEQKRMEEIYKLKILEQDKKLRDAQQLADDYKRKLEQGSQQLQGEVLELELENMLKHEFPYDEIVPVAKGSLGGDIIQTVRNNSSKSCGKIIWEFKRTKSWSNEWLSKLKNDQRQISADVAIIITQALPQNIKNFGCCEDVWVGDYNSVLGLALALRKLLLEVTMVKGSIVGRNDKKELLFNYIYSVEFKHRVQAIAEAFTNMREDLQKEKNWFRNKWNKQEKIIQQVMDNTYGMYGDLQGIVGKNLEDLENLEILPQTVQIPHTSTSTNGKVEIESPETLF
jgi:hypothetical protein